MNNLGVKRCVILTVLSLSGLIIMSLNENLSVKASSEEMQSAQQPVSDNNAVPAVYDNNEIPTNPTKYASPIHQYVQIAATNKNGEFKTAPSDEGYQGAVVDDSATNYKIVCTVENTSDQPQKIAGSIFIFPRYFDKMGFAKAPVLSNDFTEDYLLKQLPKGVSLEYSKDGMFDMHSLQYWKDQSDNGKVNWSKFTEMQISSDTSLAPKSRISFSVPLKKDPNSSDFRVGAVTSSFTAYHEEAMHFAGLADGNFKKLMRGRYRAVTVIKTNVEYQDVPEDIESLMPQANLKDVTSTDFSVGDKIPQGNVDFLYGFGKVFLNLKTSGIPDIVKDKGYSVLLNKNKTPQESYNYMSVTNQGVHVDGNETGVGNGTAEQLAPYIYVTLRKVIDAKNLNLKLGDQWSAKDNFISGVDNNDKPLTIKDIKYTVNDPQGIIKNDKVTKPGEFTVTYSYKISDDYYGKGKPYIITRTAKVNVDASKVPVRHHGNHHHFSHSQHYGSINNPIEHEYNLVSTFEQKMTPLYNRQGKRVANRALGSNSSWFSDEVLTLNNEKLYRVATDEWVKASDVYLYVVKNIVIKTSDHTQRLTNAHGKLVSNRALAADTFWCVDRVATINGKPYYRVATNEFVPTDSVSIF